MIPRLLIIATALTFCMPSRAMASDFGGMVNYVLMLLAILTGGSLVLATITTAILVRVYRRKSLWWLLPVFAVLWFAVGLGINELLMHL